MKSLLLTVAVSALVAHPAFAQSPAQILEQVMERMTGTMSVAPSPSFAEGALTGCGIEFNVLLRNHVSRSGAFERVSGSFGFMMANKTIAPILKVVVHNIDPVSAAFRPAPPVRAYAVQGGRSNFKSKVASYTSDTPGALFTVFQIEPTTEMFFEAISSNKFSFRYGPSNSAMDVPVVVDLTVTDTSDNGDRSRSNRAAEEMLSCMRQLLKDAEAP